LVASAVYFAILLDARVAFACCRGAIVSILRTLPLEVAFDAVAFPIAEPTAVLVATGIDWLVAAVLANAAQWVALAIEGAWIVVIAVDIGAQINVSANASFTSDAGVATLPSVTASSCIAT
jgi:hypothetical protein